QPRDKGVKGKSVMNSTSRLWRGLGLVFILSFATLGWLGREIYLAAPPIPQAVRTDDGNTLFTGDQIRLGQQAWFKAGGQQLGTVWGHGSYVAPDWSSVTDRPGEHGLSYTSNLPHEPLVGNTMTDGSAIWTLVSIVLLIAGIAAMIWWHSAYPDGEIPTPPAADPLLQAVATP